MKNNEMIRNIVAASSVFIIGMSILFCGDIKKESNIKDDISGPKHSVNNIINKPSNDIVAVDTNNLPKVVETNANIIEVENKSTNTVDINKKQDNDVSLNENNNNNENISSNISYNDKEVEIDTSIEDIETFINNIEINTDDIPVGVIEDYINYKEGLINEYGEDTYNLMNIEAGIESEEQSLKHFIEYGI